MFSFVVLASGSRGNATLIRGPEGALLLDNGLSLAELGRRLRRLEFDPAELRAIFVTHEHGDHVSGVPLVARRKGLPVYLSRGTHQGSLRRWRGEEELRNIEAGQTVEIAGLRVRAFAVAHDTREPLHFRFECDGRALVSATDLGAPDALVEYSLREADALVLEANHDRELLLEGSYPWPIKQRILGSHGHLSNEQCAGLLAAVGGNRLQCVVLAHLSEENNRPELARSAALGAVEELRLPEETLKVAEQHQPMKWIHVE